MARESVGVLGVGGDCGVVGAEDAQGAACATGVRAGGSGGAGNAGPSCAEQGGVRTSSGGHAEQGSGAYLQLNPEIEAQMAEDCARGWKNPNAFADENVTRREANPHDAATLVRPAFVRDIEKILNIPAYNRYANKTQVFSFTENDDISHRGLHVQLVSRVARTIGAALGLNTSLIEAIALGHDIGHTPFGHAGERFLSKIYQRHTGQFHHAVSASRAGGASETGGDGGNNFSATHTTRYFNHNVHSVRVLDQLFRRNISLQVLDGVLCHNGEFATQTLERGCMNTFEQLDATVEACNTNEANIEHLRPSTLEGCVVRVADMIAYVGKDRADAVALGVMPDFSAFDSNVIGTTNSQIIHNLTTDIINNSYRQNRISMSKSVFEDLKHAKAQNYELIYNLEGSRLDKSNAVEEMFENMYERLLDDLQGGVETSPIFQHHVKWLCAGSNTQSQAQYLQTEPNLIVIDYMASMTDNYFMAVYAHLFPGEAHFLETRDYCANLA